MRKTLMIVLTAALVLAVLPATAELQNVQVGGQIRIRADYYSNYTFDIAGQGLPQTPPTLFGTQIIWPSFFLPRRPIGSGAFNGPGIVSGFAWSDRDSNNETWVEQRTRLNVKADFTNDVSAFIELDSYDIWGEDFRSDYITGLDNRAITSDDVEVYQAYIEANNMFGLPLRARIGRQELSFGSEWLVGVNDTAALFTGLSFDAVRLTYATDQFSIDAWASTLFESGINEQDGDVWFYGVYASYLGIPDITIDAYWMWVRDARSSTTRISLRRLNGWKTSSVWTTTMSPTFILLASAEPAPLANLISMPKLLTSLATLTKSDSCSSPSCMATTVPITRPGARTLSWVTLST
jgi:hypothetical protein